MATDITKRILKTIREGQESVKLKNSKVSNIIDEDVNIEKDNFLTRSKILMEEVEKKKLNEDNNNNYERKFPITKKTPQFGDVRVSQEDALFKTIGEQIKLTDDSLVYYPDSEDLVLNGEIPSLNTTFQFRLNEPSGLGCFVWSDGLQLTDENARTLGKIRDAFNNFKQSLLQNGDLMDMLKKTCEKNIK